MVLTFASSPPVRGELGLVMGAVVFGNEEAGCPGLLKVRPAVEASGVSLANPDSTVFITGLIRQRYLIISSSILTFIA